MIYLPPTAQEVMLYQLETTYKPSFQRSYPVWTTTDIPNKGKLGENALTNRR